MTLLKNFLREDQGQDLIEYTLLLAFVCLASAFLFINLGQSINGIWSSACLVTGQANSVATAAAS